MKELSLNILDVAKNSVVAGASLVEITLNTDVEGKLTLGIKGRLDGRSVVLLRLRGHYFKRSSRLLSGKLK